MRRQAVLTTHSASEHACPLPRLREAPNNELPSSRPHRRSSSAAFFCASLAIRSPDDWPALPPPSFRQYTDLLAWQETWLGRALVCWLRVNPPSTHRLVADVFLGGAHAVAVTAPDDDGEVPSSLLGGTGLSLSSFPARVEVGQYLATLRGPFVDEPRQDQDPGSFDIHPPRRKEKKSCISGRRR